MMARGATAAIVVAISLGACGPSTSAVTRPTAASPANPVAAGATGSATEAVELPYAEGPLALFARTKTEELLGDSDITPRLFLLRLGLDHSGADEVHAHRLTLAYDGDGLHLLVFEPRSSGTSTIASDSVPQAVQGVAEAFLREATQARASTRYPPLDRETLGEPLPLPTDAAIARELASLTLTSVAVEAYAVLGRRPDGARVLVEASHGASVTTPLP